MNGGIYFFKKKFLNILENKNINLEKNIIPKLIKKKLIKAKKFNNFFLDIGTPNNYIYAKKRFKKFFFKPAIFLDIDGVLNVDNNYTYKIDDLKLISKNIKYLKKKDNYYKFVVSNRAGIAKKSFKFKQFINFQKKILKELSKNQIFINDTRHCPKNQTQLSEN